MEPSRIRLDRVEGALRRRGSAEGEIGSTDSAIASRVVPAPILVVWRNGTPPGVRNPGKAETQRSPRGPNRHGQMVLHRVAVLGRPLADVNGHSKSPPAVIEKVSHPWVNRRPAVAHVPAIVGLTTPDFSLSFNR